MSIDMNYIKEFNFISPTKLVLGNGASQRLGNYAKELGIKKLMIITDDVILSTGIFDGIQSSLEENDIEWSIFSDVEPEPPVENCYSVLEKYVSDNCDGFLGLGGGSAIDVAKAAAMLDSNGGKYEDYVGIGNVPKKCSKLILMPTTSGTGSEVSMFSIMIVNGSKMGVVDANITADIALVDPLLTVTVPRKVTAATGLDALCHHIESFISTNASPLSNMICLEGIKVISRNLRKAYGNLEDEKARYWMSYGSTMGGYVMNLTDGAAANHGLAFAIGAKFHLSHGLSNAVMLPHVFPVVAIAELEKTRLIGEAMGLNLKGFSDREVVDRVTEAFTDLVKDVGCLIPLKDFGIAEDDLDMLVQEVVNTQGRVMGHSTYQLSPDEIKEIFRSAL